MVKKNFSIFSAETLDSLAMAEIMGGNNTYCAGANCVTQCGCTKNGCDVVAKVSCTKTGCDIKGKCDKKFTELTQEGFDTPLINGNIPYLQLDI